MGVGHAAQCAVQDGGTPTKADGLPDIGESVIYHSIYGTVAHLWIESAIDQAVAPYIG